MTFLRSMPCVALVYSSPTTFEYAVVTLSPGTVPSFSASEEIVSSGASRATETIFTPFAR